MDSQILDHAMQILQPLAVLGPGIGEKVLASALWDWIKEKFQKRSLAAAEAIKDVETTPQSKTNWEVLRAQLAEAISEDHHFHEELTREIAKITDSTKQSANVSGDNNKTAQVSGNQNSISM
jgi:hypothetical protein